MSAAADPSGAATATVELDVPARPEFVALVRLVVSSFASGRRDLEDDRLDDLKLAVSEACTNAIEAHARARLSEPVLVRCTEAPDHLDIEVVDLGGGFDPAGLPEHPPVTDPERLNFERGLGIPLIRTLVDDAEFVPSDDGTRVRMRVSCPPLPGPGGA